MKVILKQTLKNKGKSIYWLAKETGIAASTLSNMSNNKTTRIDFSVLDKVCATLNCTPNDIIIPDNYIKAKVTSPAKIAPIKKHPNTVVAMKINKTSTPDISRFKQMNRPKRLKEMIEYKTKRKRI